MLGWEPLSPPKNKTKPVDVGNQTLAGPREPGPKDQALCGPQKGRATKRARPFGPSPKGQAFSAPAPKGQALWALDPKGWVLRSPGQKTGRALWAAGLRARPVGAGPEGAMRWVIPTGFGYGKSQSGIHPLHQCKKHHLRNEGLPGEGTFSDDLI